MKSSITFLILLSLSACTTGYMKKTPLTDNDGNVVRASYLFGLVNRVVYTTERKSRTAVLAEQSTKKIEKIVSDQESTENLCAQILDKEAQGVADQAEQFRSFSDCLRTSLTNQLVATALGRPTNDVQSVNQETSKQIKAVQEGLTQRVQSGFKYGSSSVASVVAGQVLKSTSRHRRDENKVAFENSGDTTVGDISVNGDSATADSNDGGSGGTGAGGSGSGTSSVAGAEQTIINIGGESNSGIATDDASVLAGTDTSQQIEPSGTGSVVNDSNVDQANAIDDSNAPLNNNPSNGVIGQ